jgi:hypothetical protein
MKRRILALFGATLGALAAGLTTVAAATTQAVGAGPGSHQGSALLVASVSDTVIVQVAVVSAVVFVVVIVGLVAYNVRKRLGLVPPPPDQPAGGHH